MSDIFISHASKDVRLVEALVQLIEGGIGIRTDQVFCTSLEDQSIPAGEDFKSYIKNMLGEAKVVIAVISPQYYNSPFCMCELGATWALTKTFVPLLVPPVDYNDLRGSLFGTQVLPLNVSEKLDTLHSAIAHLAVPPGKVFRWNNRKTQFLDGLSTILKSLAPIRTLSEKEAEQLRKDRDEYKQEFEKSDTQISELKRQIDELEKVKDKEVVNAIKRKHSTSWDSFKEQIKTTKSTTDVLPKVVRDALYYFVQGKEYVPEYDKWHNAPNDAVEQNLLKNHENTFPINTDHPKIARAVTALESLQELIREFSGEFRKEYQDRYDDILDMSSRTFWDRHYLS